MRLLALLYGLFNYLTALAVILYGIGWLGNFGVPHTIDSGSPVHWGIALIVNSGLIFLFAVQHTIQALPSWKRWVGRCTHKAVERSTYVLFSNLCFVLIYWLWQPMEGWLWRVENPIGAGLLWFLFALGWVLALTAILIKNHFHFLGLRQIWRLVQHKQQGREPLRRWFLYSLVRHPMYLGFLMAYWFTPQMSTSHFLFALLMTVYTGIGIRYEEEKLLKVAGHGYADYRQRTPALIPFLPNRLSGKVRQSVVSGR